MTIDSLREFGANVDEGIERCMGMEDFYLEMIELGLSDDRFEKLLPAIENKNMEESFELVHALKGVIGNLSLTPLYETICEITEHLRNKDDIDYEPLCDKLTTQRNQIMEMM